MRYNAQKLRERGSRARLRLGNMVRRVAIAASQGGAWALEGYLVPDLRGGGGFSTEGEGDEPAEAFQGIGIYARPAPGDNAEAIALQVGGEADHPVLAAMRNEAARQRYLEAFDELGEGELAVFNSAGSARVLVRADGTIEITAASGQEVLIASNGGTPEPLATKADVDALAAHVDGHRHAGALGGTGSAPALTSPPTNSVGGAPTDTAPDAGGTLVVKGE